MRPPSHRTQQFARCCGTCCHVGYFQYQSSYGLLCFRSDSIERSGDRVTRVNDTEAADYLGEWPERFPEEVWAERNVNHNDVCDEWRDIAHNLLEETRREEDSKA